MSIDRQQAQQRADDIEAFIRESARLRAELPLEQTAPLEAIAAHHRQLLGRLRQEYDVDYGQQARQLTLGMRVASLFGALALGASVFFLFYRFWGLFGVTTQVAVLVAAAVFTALATFWIAARDESGYFAKLAALLALVCLVLNTVMLGQIFNITPSENALLAWSAYALLLAYQCRARLLLAAACISFYAFVAARVGTWSGLYWLSFGDRPEHFFVAAALLIALPQVISQARYPGFAALYRIFGLLGLFLPMLVLANWGRASYLPWSDALVEGGYQVLGFACAALAVWAGVRRGWPEVVNTGIVFFVLFLYTKLFDWWWEVMPKYLFFLILSLISIFILLVLKRLRRPLRGGTSA